MLKHGAWYFIKYTSMPHHRKDGYYHVLFILFYDFIIHLFILKKSFNMIIFFELVIMEDA